MSIYTASSKFEKFSTDDRWLGFGYLGERQNAEDLDLIRRADEFVVLFAETAGWSDEDLFRWSNSKLGRWFGDYVFGGDRAWATRSVEVGLFDLSRIEAL